MADKNKQKAADPGLQKAADLESEQGFSGIEVDPTPNERYSLESEDWRTPENDPETHAAAQKQIGRFADAAKEEQA